MTGTQQTQLKEKTTAGLELLDNRQYLNTLKPVPSSIRYRYLDICTAFHHYCHYSEEGIHRNVKINKCIQLIKKICYVFVKRGYLRLGIEITPETIKIP